MKKPKMILFDYGQTLVNEEKFDRLKGTKEVLKYAIQNRHNITAEQVQQHVEEINNSIGRFDPLKKHQFVVEIPNYMFSSYLYQSLGIKLSLSAEEIDRVFWDASSPGKPTEGIDKFLQYLDKQGIRTGVISNITYNSKLLKENVNSNLPNNNFEFIIATSEYMFRKPNKRIFNLALEFADLNAEDVWYIGDNYECDVMGSRNAGMFPIWYVGAKDDISNENMNDVLTIKSWYELMEITKW